MGFFGNIMKEAGKVSKHKCRWCGREYGLNEGVGGGASYCSPRCRAEEKDRTGFRSGF